MVPRQFEIRAKSKVNGNAGVPPPVLPRWSGRICLQNRHGL